MAGSDDSLWERGVGSELIYDQGFLRLLKDEVQTARGDITTREYIIHPGAAAVLAWTDDDRLLLIHQFRYAVGRVCLEIPAGRVDPGEVDHLVTAQRELREETGFSAQDWRYLGPIFPSVGYSNEVIHIYEARNLQYVGQSLDPHEYVTLITMSRAELIQAITLGEIPDAKTLAALRLAGI
jgi:ADP-ribose pyrophosphatase